VTTTTSTDTAAAIDQLVAGATKALAEYSRFTQEDVDRLVKKAAVAALDQHGHLAELAVEETGRGVFEDKAVKNIFACEHVTNSMSSLKTVGVISRDEINGITEIAEPVGVICAMTPVTNPTSTAIFKSLIALKTRNPIPRDPVIDRIDHRKASAVSATAATPAAATPAVPVSRELEGTAKASWGYTLLGLTRLMVGFTFLWAFLDKVFGLGFSTPTEHSWLHGGSPTSGFLVASIEGGNPFAGVWSVFLAINPVTDVLFMLGLLGVGLALMLGIGTRVAAVSGAAMYTLMYLAAFPMSTNPLYDTHLLLAVAVLAMAGLAAGDHLGLGKQWAHLEL
jgi:uncharacterized membrane protein YphA (DoxX/SURF4 family)